MSGAWRGFWARRAALVFVIAGCTGSCSSGDGGSRGEPPPAAKPGDGSQGAGNAAPPPLEVGNADTGMQPMSGAKPGTFVPSAMLDPNAEFDWPEAEGSSKCEPGTYVGSFSCTFMIDPAQADMLLFPPDDIPPVTGPITLTFEKSANGEFLELANAKLEGTAMDFIGFDAQLSGRLDCATMQLTAQITTGEFGFGSPVLFQFGEISGDLNGTLDGKTGVLTGDWAIGVGPPDMMFGACTGPWMANFTP